MGVLAGGLAVGGTRVTALALLAALLFAAGVVAGSAVAGVVPDDQKGEMARSLQGLLERLGRGAAGDPAAFYRSLAFNLKTAVLLWLLGAFAFGWPFIGGILFLRGLVLGFAVAFLVLQEGMRGLWLAVAAVLPPSLLAVPALLLLGLGAAAFSLGRWQRQQGLGRRNARAWLAYALLGALCALALAAASLMEGYLSPYLVALVARAP